MATTVRLGGETAIVAGGSRAIVERVAVKG
jgi:hypothetical protein